MQGMDKLERGLMGERMDAGMDGLEKGLMGERMDAGMDRLEKGLMGERMDAGMDGLEKGLMAQSKKGRRPRKMSRKFRTFFALKSDRHVRLKSNELDKFKFKFFVLFFS